MTDKDYILDCFKLAEKGTGRVSPNPLVGSVIVKEGRIISRGWHEYFGAPHAEAMAIQNCDEELAGATLYCNLEPCCHTNKKTPPCAPQIIASGIKKVVISNVDPNPEVSGKGIKMLRDAGIEVVTGVEEEAGKKLNKFFIYYITRKTPYITLKIASSLDGYISASDKEQTWLTGEISREFVHRLRAEYDAVLVGANTVNIDNPKLNVRLIEGRDPFVFILDGKLSISPESFIIQNSSHMVTIYTGTGASPEKISLLRKKGVTVSVLPTGENGMLDLNEVLANIGAKGISSVLVEGGAGVFSQFVALDLFNEINLIFAPVILGDGLSFASIKDQKQLKFIEHQKLGEDLLMVLKR